jgi:hypothetical protein
MRAASISFFIALESTMNRFFFNLVSKDNKICDPNGKEFIDLAYAHRHAMLLIQKIAMLDDESDWQGWSIEVTDASNRSVLSVLFPHTSRFQSKRREGVDRADRFQT